ncbi:unnamed protein product [Moneuplotes crassus]|uniref:B30.2/SPRY domain-containing protein n=1 Tax=Euplotes crassus TaxID=5936 RepID=A0AAD1XZE9_EUPCR|nr:unnamed protein product [Moneuplotes crassus]
MELEDTERKDSDTRFTIYTSFGYGTVEDEKIVEQLSNKKYIKVKKDKKKQFEAKDARAIDMLARMERRAKRKKKKIVKEKKERKKKVSNSLFEEMKRSEEAEENKLAEYQPPEVEIVQSDNMFEINPEDQKSEKNKISLAEIVEVDEKEHLEEAKHPQPEEDNKEEVPKEQQEDNKEDSKEKAQDVKDSPKEDEKEDSKAEPEQNKQEENEKQPEEDEKKPEDSQKEVPEEDKKQQPEKDKEESPPEDEKKESLPEEKKESLPEDEKKESLPEENKKESPPEEDKKEQPKEDSKKEQPEEDKKDENPAANNEAQPGEEQPQESNAESPPDEVQEDSKKPEAEDKKEDSGDKKEDQQEVPKEDEKKQENEEDEKKEEKEEDQKNEEDSKKEDKEDQKQPEKEEDEKKPEKEEDKKESSDSKEDSKKAGDDEGEEGNPESNEADSSDKKGSSKKLVKAEQKKLSAKNPFERKPSESKKPKEDPPKSDSEYEEVTDPEFDAFNSDDSAEKSRIVSVNFNWGGEGRLTKKQIKIKIRIFVKTFFGNRTKHEVVVGINDRVESLVDKLNTNDELSCFHVIKFIYPMGRVKHLSMSDTFANQNIPEGACLVMIGKKDFHWDMAMKGRNIIIYNQLTANKKHETTHETILANVGFDSGTHYWEITIDSFVDLDDICVGVAKGNVNLYTPATETGCFWGWVATGEKKFEPTSEGRQISRFGEPCKIGDIVGVLLQFDNGFASLSFYRNKVFIGNAFDNIPPGTLYPAVCLYYGEVQVTLNPTVKRP